MPIEDLDQFDEGLTPTREIDRMAQVDEEGQTVLESASTEQAELDGLLVKLSTGGLSLSVAIGAFRSSEQTRWLEASWFAFLLCVVLVVASKYLSVETHRKAYLGIEHEDSARRQKAEGTARTLDQLLGLLNYGAGVAFLAGAFLTVLHVLNVQ